MTRPSPLTVDPRSSRLFLRPEDDRSSLWTVALGDPPSVHGEPIRSADGQSVRRWDASRSKLAAGLLRGYRGAIPRPGERWLYLGAATGTTATHVADLVGPSGVVVAVEVSPRPFVRLLAVARRYPNLWPVLADARDPAAYAGLVPPADGVYCDVSQPDQVELLLRNAEPLLVEGGSIILALKTASLSRTSSPQEHLARTARALQPRFALAPAVALQPFHRRHFLLGSQSDREREFRPRRPVRPRHARRDRRRR